MMDETLKKKIEEFQNLQNTLQTILVQKQGIQLQLLEIENAINEINNLEEGKKIFKLIGNLLFEEDKEKLLTELKERKEALEIRLNSLNKQEEKIKERLTILQGELMRLGKKNGG